MVAVREYLREYGGRCDVSSYSLGIVRGRSDKGIEGIFMAVEVDK